MAVFGGDGCYVGGLDFFGGAFVGDGVGVLEFGGDVVEPSCTSGHEQTVAAYDAKSGARVSAKTLVLCWASA